MTTFADILQSAKRNSSGRTALVCGDEHETYGELLKRAELLAGGLRGLGLKVGDRVAILVGNCHRYVEVYMGVPAAGFVVVPLNTRHAGPELHYALEDSGARVLITDRDPGALADLVEHVIRMPGDYEALLGSSEKVELGSGIDENSLAGLFYTGGTTGASKGVMLSHRNLIANAFHFLAVLPETNQDRFLVMAPLFHAAGSVQIISTALTGASQVMLAAFDPAAALDLIEKESITMTLGVPTMIAAVAEEADARPRKTDTLRVIMHGGSPIATEIVRRIHAAVPTAELTELYGATEVSPIATFLRHEEELVDDKRGRSCGQAIHGVSVSILDPNDPTRECDDLEVGEVVVRGPNVMQGYWNKPDQTASVLKDGQYWTGDLGYMDDEGFLFLVDRSKDMIVSGGENVYSTEVEEVLYQHPAVVEAAVFGVPDERWGEAVYAAVVLRDGAGDVTAEALIAHCREQIAGYKVPKAIELCGAPLPKSGPGKILKRELRAPFWAGRDTQVGG